jgi:hypothetical protein
LSDATPSVAELMKLGKSTLKNRKTSNETNKKIFTEFGYRNSDQAAKEPWTEAKHLIS